MTDYELREWTHVSPSQITAFRRCELRWWWQTIAGFRSPETGSQKLGKAIHAELEAYLCNGELPTSRVALSGITRLPNPEDVDEMDVEFGFQLHVDGMPVPVIGFIDLKEPAAHRITDHKTTSDFKYAKSADELEGDPQAILYCAVGPEPEIVGAPIPWGDPAEGKCVYPVIPRWRGPVTFRHIYYRTQGGAISTEREVQYRTHDQLEKQMIELVQVTQRMARAASLEAPANVAVNLSACDDFGGCPHRARCAALGHAVFGAASGIWRPKALRQQEQESPMTTPKMSPLALLKSRGTAPAPDAAAALAKLQAMTPEQYADAIAQTPGEVQVCQAFASGASRTNAALLPESAVAGLVGRGLFRIEDAKVLIPTELGTKVITVLAARGVITDQRAATPASAPATPPAAVPRLGGLLGRLKAPAKPTQLALLRDLSPKLTASWTEGADAAEGVLKEIATILEAEPQDGSITDSDREIFVGLFNDGAAEIERLRNPPPEAPKPADPPPETSEDGDDIPEIQIEIGALEQLFIEGEGNGPKVGDWWKQKFGTTIEDGTAVGQMALDDGTAYEMDNGLVLLITDEISGVLCPPELMEKFNGPTTYPFQGAGSAINPPDGVKSDTPDADLPPTDKNKGGRPVLGPILPDGTNVRKLNKKDLVDAHTKLFADLEGTPGIKVYRGATKLPEKRAAVEDYYADIELVLKVLADPSNVSAAPQDAAPPAAPVRLVAAPSSPPAPTPPPKTAERRETPTEDAPRAGFRLYVGCRPVRGGDVVELAEFLLPFEQAVAEEEQVAHYLEKPFKDGIKAVITKLQISYNRSELALPPAIYVPRDHPAAGEAVAFLTRFASEIVRVTY